MPVVLLAGGASQPLLTAAQAGWDEMEYHGPYDILMSNHVPDPPKTVDGVRVGSPVARGNWYSGFSPENQYVPLDDIPFGEIVSLAREKIAQLGYDGFDLDHPVRVWAHHRCAYGTQTDVLPGYLYMEVRPMAAGIPVLSHISQTVGPRSGTNRSDEFSLTPS